MKALDWCKAWMAVLVIASGVWAQAIDWNAEDITINTADELAEFRDRVNGGKNFLGQTITLGSDIALSGNWTPIGSGTPIGADETKQFRGTFDGGGHSISNLYVSGVQYAGFFGWIDADGQIKNLIVNVTEIVATSSIGVVTLAGGLAAMYVSTKPIENCGVNIKNRVYVTSDSSSYSGGLVGYAHGATIINSYTTGNVSATSTTTTTVDNVGSGGLIGAANGVTIINSYTTGNVSATASATTRVYSGGLVGYSYSSSSIINSYAVGTMSGNNSGGIYGRTVAALANSVYFNSEGASQAASNGGTLGISSKTPEQLRIQGTFEKWDFNDTWRINSTINNGFPVLLFSHNIKNNGITVSSPISTSYITHNSITVNTVLVPGSIQMVEYAINTENNVPENGWQESTTFSGLAHSTIYYIFARSKENDNYCTGTPSTALQVSTAAITGVITTVFYLDENGNIQSVAATLLTGDETMLADGWYFIQDEISYLDRLHILPTGIGVHIILGDGSHLNASNGGINVPAGNNLTIYAQSIGDDIGKLTAAGGNSTAGIGGYDSCGNGNIGGAITINGGTINAAGYIGIGGCGYTITINGGTVTANTTNGGPFTDIGGTGNSTITITGGTVTTGRAIGCSHSCGIVNILIYGENTMITTRIIGLIQPHTGGIENVFAILPKGQLNINRNDRNNVYDVRFTANPAINDIVQATLPSLNLEQFDGRTINLFGGNLGMGANAKTMSVITTFTTQEFAFVLNNQSVTKTGNELNALALVTFGTPFTMVNYLDEDGAEQKRECMDYFGQTSLATGCYYVLDEFTPASRITITGNVYLILADDSYLNAKDGIEVSAGNSITICAQSTGDNMGKLTANIITNDSFSYLGSGDTGIGGSGKDGSSGTITINGGIVTAWGGLGGRAIGGSGNGGSSGTITINGGTVNANGQINGGIGVGLSGIITINGGTVTATGGNSGIGVGLNGIITINGGTVTATGSNLGIGASSGGNIAITGGTVNAIADNNHNGVGINGGNILIYGENTMVTAKGGWRSASALPWDIGVGSNVSVLVILPKGQLLGTNDVPIGHDIFFTANPTVTDGMVQATLPAPFNIPPFSAETIDLFTSDFGMGANAKIMSVITTFTTQELVFTQNNQSITKTGNELDAFASVAFGIPFNVVNYLDENGVEQERECLEYFGRAVLTTGCYYFSGESTPMSRIIITGDVHLILANDSRLDASNGGIGVSIGNSLSIYAQSIEAEMGRLTAVGGRGQAGIGGDNDINGRDNSSGTIIIAGGMVTASGGSHGGAGIGGGGGGSIGGGNGGNITITGGIVSASGGLASTNGGGAGIGGGGGIRENDNIGSAGGNGGSGGAITINGGMVTASSGGHRGAGIGGGGGGSIGGGSGGNITITGGMVTATGSTSGGGFVGIGGGAGIGNGSNGGYNNAFSDNNIITITGGIVNAKGGSDDIGTGGFYYAAPSNTSITVTGGSVFAANNRVTNRWVGPQRFPIKVTVVDVNDITRIDRATVMYGGTYAATTGGNYTNANFNTLDQGVAWLWLPAGVQTISASTDTDDGSNSVTVVSSGNNPVTIAVPAVINIDTEPTLSTNVTYSKIIGDLSVTASVSHSSTVLSYQWYLNTKNSNTNGTKVLGATSSTFAIPTDLDVGIHYYFCEVNASGGIASVRTNVAMVTVDKATGVEIFAPTPVSKTYNSITINDVPAPENGQVVEYAINTENNVPASGWQTEFTFFSGLTPNTIYYVFARVKENDNYYAGEPSVLTAKTFPQNDWLDNYDVSWYLLGQTEFTITTPEQLAGLAYLVHIGADNFSGKTINLRSNISLNNAENWQNWATDTYAEIKLWTPIGTSANPFRGTFNGNGFVISGLYIDNTSDNQGLFGVVNSGKIEKLGIIASYIKGINNIGALAGNNANATITDCFSIANTAGSTNIGGLIGNSNNTAITSSYTASNSELLGTRTGGSVTSSYFLSAMSENGTNGFARTETQMKAQNTYLGWDFVSPVWKIDNSGIINDGYPYLHTIKAACLADGKVWENNACRNKTVAELCTEAGNHWDNGECKTDAQLAEEACVADGKVWENNACRNKTAAELCTEAGNHWDNGECKTDAQLAEEACLADGKVWENNACRNKTDTELCVEAGNTWDNGECKTDAQLAEEACLADGKVWQDNACRDDNTPIIPNPENPKIGAIGVQTYYNLHGQPLGTQKPTIPGVYIEKRGKYMRKIAVR